MIWHLQFTIDGPGGAWIKDEGVPFRSLEWALASLRMCARGDDFNGWRLVDSNGVTVVSMVPGCRGEA